MREQRRGAVRPRHNLVRDPFLLTLIALTAVAGALLYLFQGHGARQVQVYWLAQVPLDAALGLGAWRLRALAEASYRRFYTSIAFAGLMFMVGDGFQTVRMLVGPTPISTDGGTVQSAFFAVGMFSNVLACMVFPQGLRSAREKLVFWLDATTVLVGGGVMAWCFAVNPASAHVDRVTASLTAALVIVGAFSATKVALIPRPPMSRTAAWPMVAAPMVQGISTFLPGPFQHLEHPYVFVVRLLPSLLIAMGPRIQEVTVRLDGFHVRSKRRPYSLLPYGMIALTFVVFFLMLPAHVSTRLWGATAGVVVITGLVAARQLVSFQDNVMLISRLAEQETRLREQAATDSLTNLANRTRFNDETAAAMTADELPTVLLIDLDDFKTINDTMGHAAGDALLVGVGDRLRAAVREGDVVARLGGDEFAILLRGAGVEDGGQVAEDILRRLDEPVAVQKLTVVTRASIGVAGARAGDEPSALLSNADIAMYEAKRRGKSTWVLYTDEMGARIGAEAEMAHQLGLALEAGEFALLYQPIVRLDDMTMTGVEALIRWHHPVLGLISPDRFIPIAERSGQIVQIGRWVMWEACRQGADWRRRFPDSADISIGVNVAGRQLRTPGFVEEVAGVLEATGLPARCLSVEVTETAVLDDEESNEAMERLRGMGVRLALDDFGTAASSLGLLLTCPMTTLKLDRSFVESITTVGRQAAVATAVSQMATALHLASVAEGIETREQLALLRDLNYQYGQGFLFSRPVPPAELEKRWAPEHTLSVGAHG